MQGGRLALVPSFARSRSAASTSMNLRTSALTEARPTMPSSSAKARSSERVARDTGATAGAGEGAAGWPCRGDEGGGAAGLPGRLAPGRTVLLMLRWPGVAAAARHSRQPATLALSRNRVPA